jgi:uncharacterized protein (DUF2249 family)
MTKYFIPNIDARKSLADKLNLKYHDNMQDWEYEVADMNRLADFENQYLLSDTNDKEKESLMEIMLDSLNDSLELNDLKIFNDFAPRILKYLKENNQIHEGTINYWTEGDFLISNKVKPTIEK